MAHSAHGHTKLMWGQHCQMPGHSNVFPIIDMSPNTHANYFLGLLLATRRSKAQMPCWGRAGHSRGHGPSPGAGDLSTSYEYYICIAHKKCHPIAIHRPNNRTIKNVLERWTTRDIKGSGRAYVSVTVISPGPKGVLPHRIQELIDNTEHSASRPHPNSISMSREEQQLQS